MSAVLKIIGAILVFYGFSTKDVGIIIVGIVLFIVGFWLGSATREYINRNK